MRIHLIVAAAENGVIGRANRLPWHLPADLKHFKALTTGHPILMGRKTFESIGKPLPGRTNIVISRQPNLKIRGALTARSLAQGLELCRDQSDCFVIGGAKLFQAALPQADRIHLTRIHTPIEGDTFLFEINPAVWEQTDRADHESDGVNPYPYSFITLEKMPKGSDPS